MITPAGSSASISSLYAAPLQGIARGLEQAEASARKIAGGDLDPRNMVDQSQAVLLVKANVAVMRTADEVLGALLDERA